MTVHVVLHAMKRFWITKTVLLLLAGTSLVGLFVTGSRGVHYPAIQVPVSTEGGKTTKARSGHVYPFAKYLLTEIDIYWPHDALVAFPTNGLGDYVDRNGRRVLDLAFLEECRIPSYQGPTLSLDSPPRQTPIYCIPVFRYQIDLAVGATILLVLSLLGLCIVQCLEIRQIRKHAQPLVGGDGVNRPPQR